MRSILRSTILVAVVAALTVPAFAQAMQSLEGMAAMGWVRCSKVPGLATLTISTPEEGDIVYTEKLGPRSK